jgi:hypothetical protein
LRIRQGLVVPEAKDAIPLSFEKCRSLSVSSRLQRVLTAVKLDDEFSFRAAKVHDEGTDGMLAAEPRTAEPPIPKSLPQPPLNIRLVATESARVAT